MSLSQALRRRYGIQYMGLLQVEKEILLKVVIEAIPTYTISVFSSLKLYAWKLI